MPVYLRKNVNFTPPSLDHIPQDEDDDYVTDPEQLKDTLPQPYRMIDKVLNNAFETAWEIIERRENARIEESKKIRPPQYDCAIAIEAFGGATSIVDSNDGKYIFVGLPNGISVLGAENQAKICTWEEDKVEIIHIKAHKIGDNKYLVVSIDDLGFARLFGLAGDRLFLLRLLNEQQDGGSATKLLIHKCEASAEGEYLGSLYENPTSGEVWLEIAKLPKDIWITELDNKLADIQKELDKKDDKEKEKVEETPVPAGEEGEELVAQNAAAKVTGRQSRKLTKKESHVDVHLSDKGLKFSAPTLVHKLKPPPPVLAVRNRGNLAPTVHLATQKVDTGDVIGTGQNHILTTNNLETRQDVFKHLHDSLMDYLPNTQVDPNVVPDVTFHFLSSGRLPNNPPESSNNPESPVAVTVWWKDSTHVMHYSLFKSPSKDGEVKPDLVWPYTSKVTSSIITPDSSLIIIGLQNGNIVVWDRYLGVQRGVVSITDTASIKQMWFLDPSICPQEVANYPPYPTKSFLYLLILCSDGAMFYCSCGAGISSEPQCVLPPCKHDDDKFGRVQPITGIPELLLTVQQKGSIQIRDTLQGKVICECRLPDTHQLMSPWDPIITTGANGQMLYVRGTVKERVPEEGELEEAEKEEETPKTTLGMLFVFQLRSFPTLDEYNERQRKSVPYKIHTTIDKRVDALMTERIAQQGLRKTRMQERWGLLRDEIWSILQYKEQAEKKAEHRPVYNFQTVFHYQQTPGSVGWTPIFK